MGRGKLVEIVGEIKEEGPVGLLTGVGEKYAEARIAELVVRGELPVGGLVIADTPTFLGHRRVLQRAIRQHEPRDAEEALRKIIS